MNNKNLKKCLEYCHHRLSKHHESGLKDAGVTVEDVKELQREIGKGHVHAGDTSECFCKPKECKHKFCQGCFNPSCTSAVCKKCGFNQYVSASTTSKSQPIDKEAIMKDFDKVMTDLKNWWINI